MLFILRRVLVHQSNLLLFDHYWKISRILKFKHLIQARQPVVVLVKMKINRLVDFTVLSDHSKEKEKTEEIGGTCQRAE